ncbi:hypothetical protein [Microbacterium jejuense]|uniref:hypothetical protein n=1 Tax=Microbacterium jejuense TaxID=1263637 RepID=UPI0031E7DC50
MADDRQNTLARREILAAYIDIINRLGELIEICSAVEGDTEELRKAVQASFGLSPVAADAVLSMQVRRFTPNERQKIRDELADIDIWLAETNVT